MKVETGWFVVFIFFFLFRIGAIYYAFLGYRVFKACLQEANGGGALGALGGGRA